MEPANPTVFILGLGYVGLPLAVALGWITTTLAWDESDLRRGELQAGVDPRGSVAEDDLRRAEQLRVVDDPAEIGRADFVIVCVPTPVLDDRTPDLRPLLRAVDLVGKYLRKGSIVVFESTVYPGATEELCVPLLQKSSGLIYGQDFSVAYSPERINPGDPAHGLRDVVKVVAAGDPTALARVAELYERVVPAGVYRAGCIRVAEAAKVLENVQRDVNIALMNEFSQIMEQMGLDTLEVLSAARTKWNFLPFAPGLVGGHCVAVDPYYLAYAARASGVEPQLIAVARVVNEQATARWAGRIVESLRAETQRRVLVFGMSFKKDCADLRNSKVVELVELLRAAGCVVDGVDPLVASAARRTSELQHRTERSSPSPMGVENERHWRQVGSPPLACEDELTPGYEAVVLAVDHSDFRTRPLADFLRFLAPGGLVVDLHGMFPVQEIVAHGYRSIRP